MDRIYVFGDSQAGALVQALMRRPREQRAQSRIAAAAVGFSRLFQVEFFATEGGFRITSPEILERWPRTLKRLGISDLTQTRGRLVLSLGLAAAPFYGKSSWETRDVGATSRPGRQYVSRGVVDQIVADLQAQVLDFYGFCIREGLLLAAMDAAPPQRRHPAFEHLGEAGVLELTRAYQAPVRALLASHGYPLITAPGTTDRRGFLKPEYARQDYSHANAEYGALMLAQLETLLPDAAAASAPRRKAKPRLSGNP